jgi:hypothetical protein
LAISVASPLRIFNLKNQIIILPIGPSSMLDLSSAWVIDLEKASLSKALGPSASSKFEGACACSLLDRYVVCLSTDVTTMVLDSETLMVKSGTASNLPPVAKNYVRLMFSAATYAVCASVTSIQMETGHYFVTGFDTHSAAFCHISDVRNLNFKSFGNLPDNIFERAFIVLGASGFYVLALHENDGDAIDLLRSIYCDVSAGASFSVDSDGSVSRLLQSAGYMLPRYPIRCTPKSLSILCANVKHAVILVISSSQLELLRCPVTLPPRSRSWLCSCVASSPVGWILCLDSESVPLVMFRVNFAEDASGSPMVSQSMIELVSAVLPFHAISLLGDGVHTVIAPSRKERNFGDALCLVGRHLVFVNDFASPPSPAIPGSPSLSSSERRLGSLV